MMAPITPSCFSPKEEADHTMCIKGITGSTQAPFRQTGFLSPFCWQYAEQGDGSDPFPSYKRCSGVRHHCWSR